MTTIGPRNKEEKEEELRFLKQEEQYLLDLIARVDGRINTLEVESMTIKREMRMRNEDATSSDPGENRGDSQDMQYQDQAVGVEEEAPVQAELVDEPDLDLDVTRTLMSLSRFSCDPHDFEEEEDD